MFTVDTFTQNCHGDTKSSLQALLKTREHIPISSTSLEKETNSINHFSDQVIISQAQIPHNNSLYLTANGQSINESNSSENIDTRKDFHYSQKLFHIADGNLYSIFSPIQGRSYGMKPSFLRKQKYTVQECHNRNRKSMRKGLKFHNFLPSESITSEKDNGYLRSKWKIHSECRLREEHGTKQITISNWSKSVQNPNDQIEKVKHVLKSEPKSILKCETSSSSSTSNQIDNLQIISSNHSSNANKNCVLSRDNPDNDLYNFDTFLQNSNSSNECYNEFSKQAKTNALSNKTPKLSEKINSKKDCLDSLLNTLLEKPILDKNNTNSTKQIQKSSLIHNQKHRRKPTQTRKVVPYIKYLSILKENDTTPLDLSSKRTISNSNIDNMIPESRSKSLDNLFSFNTKINNNENRPSSLNQDLFNSLSTSSTNLNISSNHPVNYINNVPQTNLPLTLMYPLTLNENSLKQSLTQNDSNNLQPKSLNTEVHSKIDKTESSFNNFNQNSLTNGIHYSVQKSFVKEAQLKTRRRSQRAVIKQKLEDTFRQNGFLVKTKQVSDGDATFCKFRQLRKYTRYYLKSWQQHLPDEVHKMWKGFLPPKTVLPPASGNSGNSHNNSGF